MNGSLNILAGLDGRTAQAIAYVSYRQGRR